MPFVFFGFLKVRLANEKNIMFTASDVAAVVESTYDLTDESQENVMLLIKRVFVSGLWVLLPVLGMSFNATANVGVAIHAKNEGKYVIALTALKPLVELGYAPAQYELGEMYEFGMGMKKDMQKASELYHLAAKQGNAKAQFNVSTLYANGITVEKSAKEAAKWATKAANLG